MKKFEEDPRFDRTLVKSGKSQLNATCNMQQLHSEKKVITVRLSCKVYQIYSLQWLIEIKLDILLPYNYTYVCDNPNGFKSRKVETHKIKWIFGCNSPRVAFVFALTFALLVVNVLKIRMHHISSWIPFVSVLVREEILCKFLQDCVKIYLNGNI